MSNKLSTSNFNLQNVKLCLILLLFWVKINLSSIFLFLKISQKVHFNAIYPSGDQAQLDCYKYCSWSTSRPLYFSSSLSASTIFCAVFHLAIPFVLNVILSAQIDRCHGQIQWTRRKNCAIYSYFKYGFETDENPLV